MNNTAIRYSVQPWMRFKREGRPFPSRSCAFSGLCTPRVQCSEKKSGENIRETFERCFFAKPLSI